MDREEFLGQLQELPAGWGRKDCIICTGQFETEKQVRLPCHREHTIGLNCLKDWLQDHNTCPFCRCEFFPMEWAESETDEDEDDEPDVSDVSDDDEDFDCECSFYMCPDCGTFHHSEECSFCTESEDEEEEEEDRAEGLENLQTLCHILGDALGFTGPNHPIKEVAALIAEGIWHIEAIQEDSPFSNFSVAAACVFMATHLTRQPISGGRIGYLRRTTKHLAYVCRERKESIHAAYRMIYQVRDEILAEDELLEVCDASDEFRAMDRLPEPVRGSTGESEPVRESHR